MREERQLDLARARASRLLAKDEAYQRLPSERQRQAFLRAVQEHLAQIQREDREGVRSSPHDPLAARRAKGDPPMGVEVGRVGEAEGGRSPLRATIESGLDRIVVERGAVEPEVDFEAEGKRADSNGEG